MGSSGTVRGEGGDLLAYSDRARRIYGNVVIIAPVVLSDSVQGGTGASSPGTFAVLSFKALASAAQTSIRIQPGSVTGVSGMPVTMAPPSAYTFGVVGAP